MMDIPPDTSVKVHLWVRGYLTETIELQLPAMVQLPEFLTHNHAIYVQSHKGSLNYAYKGELP